jgi:Amt family ammonium transporter
VGFAFAFGGLPYVGGGNLGTTMALGSSLSVSLGGHTWGLLGTTGFMLSGSAYDVSVIAFFLFRLVFMDTTATIPTGAMAERWRWLPFVIYGFFISMILYPVYASWTWGVGWLTQLGTNLGLGAGYADFAGSGVVHSIGGWCALAGAMVLGPRLGKYTKDGRSIPMPGHNQILAILGCFILAFGWFGFNPGSSFGASG